LVQFELYILTFRIYLIFLLFSSLQEGSTCILPLQVASFTGEKQAIAQYNQYLTKAYRISVQEGVVSGFGLGSFQLFSICTYGLAIWFGGKMVLEKGYTGGQVIGVFWTIMSGCLYVIFSALPSILWMHASIYMFQPLFQAWLVSVIHFYGIILCCRRLGQASPSLKAFSAGKAAAYKMFETIKRQPDIDAYDSSGQQLDDISGNIEFREVCFSYPSRPDEQIFNRFSISISSGTTAALVGQSGSGKSTVISLIERFYDPQDGEILIDGINVREFQLKWIRQKIGLVSQEPVLFTGSIKENIAYGKDWATDEEIRAAAELANAIKFIDEFPHVSSQFIFQPVKICCIQLRACLSHYFCKIVSLFRGLTQWSASVELSSLVVRNKEYL